MKTQRSYGILNGLFQIDFRMQYVWIGPFLIYWGRDYYIGIYPDKETPVWYWPRRSDDTSTTDLPF